MSGPLPRVLIADDHPLVGEGLVSLLRLEFRVLGVFGDGQELVSEAVRLRPDLILTDIAMPHLNGIEAVKQLRPALPKAKAIFVTQQLSLDYLRAAFRAGGSGYVSKQSAVTELKVACHEVLAGRNYVTALLREQMDYLTLSKLKESGHERERLTLRRREVLRLLAEGRTTREISDLLGISQKTVDYHKKCLRDETGLRTTAELTRYALATGVISL